MILLWLMALLSCTAAAEDAMDALASPLVTPAVLKARIAEVEAAQDVADETRQRLVALYRKALSNLEVAAANADKAAAFQGAARTAPAETEALREARERALTSAPPADLAIGPDASLAELELRLQEERADLAAVQAREDDLAERLTFQERRPAAISERLADADAAREAVAAAVEVGADDREAAGEGTGGALAEARRWELETRYLALSTEIRMLDQELLSRPARIGLLTAKRDKEAASVEWIGKRVAALEERMLVERQQAAGQIRADAERVARETEAMDPVLAELSEANAELTRQTDELTAELRGLEQARVGTERLRERIGADYRDFRDTLSGDEVGGDLGAVLLEQLDTLPDLSDVRQQRAERVARIAGSNARRLRHRAEARQLSDLDPSVAALGAEMRAPPTPAQQARLRELLTHRLNLIDRLLDTEELHLTKVRELIAAQDALLAVAADYEDLLLEHLVWLRTEPPTAPRDLLAVPAQARAMLATARDAGLGNALAGGLRSSPVVWVALLLMAGLLWRRRAIVAAIGRIAGYVGKPTTDSFGHTLRVLGLTLLLALPPALPLAAFGWAMVHDQAGTELAGVLGDSLQRFAILVFTLSLLAGVCIPKGLAAAHFRWPEQNLKLLRTATRRLMWILIPAVAVLHLARDLYPIASGGMPARLASMAAYGVMAWFLFRIFHPRNGILARLRHREAYPLLLGVYWLWYPLLVLYPILLLVLGLSGFLYTVTVESYNYLGSLLLLLAVTLLDALALRWLLVVHRRLAYEAALERRQAAVAAARVDGQASSGEAADLQYDEPEVDLAALSDSTRVLIRAAVGLVAVMGLVLIWADTLPALRVLTEHTLWYTTEMVDGAEQPQPVTLLDLGLALLYAAGTMILLRRLPALLEIVLLRRYDMSAADRYAATTLVSYVIGAIGILLVLGTLGANWSQLQWMAAALSVGIGFGLQEIVANFISGLIILFERPIRVGDTVSVGDTDGVVTRIRIRATTIRNFDRKELLVPNKEFITGRLLNWSLSDPITRILLVVGVAYGSDVDKALAIMRRIAEEHEHVTDDPPPFVTFDSFGDNALTLTLRAYVDSVDVRLSTSTELNRAINRAFAEAGISIAFPQRDVHLDTTAPLRVRIERADGDATAG
jgi:potassium efflux system protein